MDRVLVGQVRLLDHVTVYARLGDLLAYLSLVVTVAALGAAVAGRAAPERTVPWLSSSMISSALSGSDETLLRLAELSLRPLVQLTS